ncbi:MAG: SMC-Scp complex subunit ScpB [Spirochaetales bacterium]|nr:SMC-Scp complex subunit ScpB [Spirochaetales bacterium]
MNEEAQHEDEGAEAPDLGVPDAAKTALAPGDLSREAAILETVLFLETEPLDIAALSRASGLGKDVVERALDLLRDELSGQAHGLEPVQVGGGWTLAPKKELWASLRERYGRKNEQKLSKAALETLSIIAYSQPITRAEIEAIRGVSADNMMRLLMDRELVQEVGKKDAPGKPIQYGTTREFLKFFRLSSIAELPRLDDVERERFALEEGEE